MPSLERSSEVTTLYEKRGRKYVPYSLAWHYEREGDQMKVGEFRLTYCYSNGGRKYDYAVTPATAPFVAAAMVAREAMEQAIRDKIVDKIVATNHIKSRPYTKKQLAIIERFRKEMSDAGGLLPSWWDQASAYEISEAAIKAVQEYKP
jgi:hypothetical protein